MMEKKIFSKKGQVWVETKPFKKRFPKKGQVWVETVIYTLIGLVLIGTVLAFVTPYVAEQRDKVVLERSAEAMNSLDNTILDIRGRGIGNSRQLSFLTGKGSLIIDPIKDEIIFKVEESNHEYSEAGNTIDIPGTNLRVRTANSGKKFDVAMTLKYDNADITYNFVDGENDGNIGTTFDAAPTPYILIIENLGRIPVDEILCNGLDGADCRIVNLGDGTCKNGKCVPDKTKINIYSTS